MTSGDSNSDATAESIETRLEDAIHSPSEEVLLHAAGDSALTEDLALSLLKRADLPAPALEAIARNSSVAKQRKVRLALAGHPKTPRHVSLPILRLLYTFDLMRLALTPIVPADVKRAADEALISRIESISLGEKLSLARRASDRIAAALLRDKEPSLIRAALENSRLTEASLVKTLTRSGTPPPVIEAVSHHPKWLLMREVRIALLRTEQLPLARALEFAQSLSPGSLREILRNSRLPASTKSYLLKNLANKSAASPAKRPAARRSRS